MKPLKLLITLLLATSCVATKYVPEGERLLNQNQLKINAPKGTDINKTELREYIQQNPNRKLLGTNLYLGIYNITDTSKNNWWHNFWGKKIGEKPVILDTAKVKRTDTELQTFLQAKGFLNATVKDTIITTKPKTAKVVYNINTKKPFKIGKIKLDIKDNFIEPILRQDAINTKLITGQQFERTTLEAERLRITELLRNKGFWGFNQTFISYVADSSLGNSTVDITLCVAQLSSEKNGETILENHPIYRLRNITLNSDYDPSQNHTTSQNYDTITANGVKILYKNRMLVRQKILLNQLGMSCGEIYDQQSVEQTYTSLRSLGYNPSIVFNPLQNQTTEPITVTSPMSQATTTQRELDCLIQCSPLVRQNFSIDFEAATTENYFSLGLRGGYQNRNLFGGAEDFNISLRGAYELLWNTGQNNAYEFGVSTSISVPRFWLPISPAKMREFMYSSTRVSLSYSRQRRPNYERSLYSVVYGYGWTLKNGARFTINPADVNIVSVPWVKPEFIEGIENPYLRNSYKDQLISGLSASYYYMTNPDIKGDGFTFRVTGDINGNLFYGLNSLLKSPKKYHAETDHYYYTLFGLEYAQYARIMAEVSNRANVGRRSQLAWRVLVGASHAYGNSNVTPIERQFFAGGSNSMRGWQARTLGPGGTLLESLGDYPEQLGDIRLEANFEYRVNVYGGLNMALFADCGNIWTNNKGEVNSEARFSFKNFYNNLALNTGVGIRYDLNFFLLRLDWGIKLHNPNAPSGQKWFGDLNINDTALHFAIGLPF